MQFDYIQIPEDTPDTRNEGFYNRISNNWRKRAKDLQERRWDKLEHSQKKHS